MTIAKILSLFDRLVPNQIDDEIKKGWLSDLDGQVFEEIIKPREDAPRQLFERYEDLWAELLAPEPYAMDLYCSYLKTKLYLEYNESDKYNQSADIFEAAMQNFRNWYCSTHPLKRVRWRFSF